MTSFSFLALITAASMLMAAPSSAAPTIDPDSPLSSIGREDDIRVEAQLLSDTVASGSSIGVNFQIHNFTGQAVAVADKVCSASFDEETQTVTLTIGSEVPAHGALPRMTTVPAGQKMTFTTGAVVRLIAASVRSAVAAVPRYVQVKVSVLRNLAPFAALMQRQTQLPPSARVPLDDQQFETWMESQGTILLNAVPVRFSGRGRSSGVEAERGGSSGSF